MASSCISYPMNWRGEIKGLTGIDDPYEEPLNPEICLTTRDCSPEDNARKIMSYSVNQGFLLGATDERNFTSPCS